jgi:hypothetical protein
MYDFAKLYPLGMKSVTHQAQKVRRSTAAPARINIIMSAAGQCRAVRITTFFAR